MRCSLCKFSGVLASRLYIVVLGLILALSGCKALLYSPTPHVIPLFERAGQVQATASLKYDNGLDLQVAGSPLPHFFLFASGTYTKSKRFEQRYGSVGGGFYIGLPSRVTVELLAGVGEGRAQGEGEREGDPSTVILLPSFEDYSYSAPYRRSFLQVNLAMRTRGDDFTIGGALRVASVRHFDFDTDPEGLVNDEVRAVFIEPAVLFRAHVNRFLDLEGQLGNSYAAREKNWELFNRISRYGSVGVRLHLGKL